MSKQAKTCDAKSLQVSREIIDAINDRATWTSNNLRISTDRQSVEGLADIIYAKYGGKE